MICSALLSQQARPEYHSLIINNSRRPGVRNLQVLIKEAWDAGIYCRHPEWFRLPLNIYSRIRPRGSAAT